MRINLSPRRGKSKTARPMRVPRALREALLNKAPYSGRGHDVV
jgi:hypothetical protein